jgi:vacuolar-type H+-ATPase subunit H
LGINLSAIRYLVAVSAFSRYVGAVGAGVPESVPTMREIVERVLGAEEEARAKIDEARKKAAAIRQEADQAASTLLAAAREKSVRDSKAALDAARATAAALMDQARQESEASAGNAEAQAGQTAAFLVDEIVAMVAGHVTTGQATKGQVP